MITDVEAAIRHYLPQIVHMSLATSQENKPWVCEVHFAFDDELNLYFRSNSQTRHCQEIMNNPHVAGNIVTQHFTGDKPRGVYFEGIAELVKDVDQNNGAYISYRDRFGIGKDAIDEALTGSGPQFYKITVNTFYLFDTRESSPGRKYELEWKSGK